MTFKNGAKHTLNKYNYYSIFKDNNIDFRFIICISFFLNSYKMKRYLPLIIFLSCNLTSFSQNLSKLDEKNGFREMKLGSFLHNYTGLVRHNNFFNGYEGITEYIKINENLKLGDIQLKKIVYSFYNDQLYSIRVELDENPGNQLRALFQDLYGVGFTTGTQRTNWSGEHVNLVLYYPSPLYKGGYFEFNSSDLYNLMTKAKQEKIKKDL
jgi:hypothetical protein